MKASATATVSERGQLTIPKRLRDRYGLAPRTEVEVLDTGEGILLRKRTKGTHPVDRVYGILKLRARTDDLIEAMRGR